MAGLAGSVITIGRAMFGTGALAMPYMFSICGVQWGMALLFTFGANAIIMPSALISSAPAANSYEEAVRICLGPYTECFLAMNILLANVGTVAVYLQIAGERLSRALTFWGIVVHRVQVTAVCSVSVLPFTFAATYGATKWTSAFSNAIALAAISAIIAVSVNHEDKLGPVVNAGSVLQGVPLSCYAFSSMSAVFPVYAELPFGRQSPYTMALVVAIAVCSAGLVYIVVGIVAAKRFGNTTEPDILSNFEVSNPSLFHCISSFYGVACLLGVPVMLFPSRRSLNYLLFRGENGMRQWVWGFQSTVLMFCAFVLAALSGTILLLLDLIGSVSAIAVDNMLPGIMFLGAQSRRQNSSMHPLSSQGGLVDPECSLPGDQLSLGHAAKRMGIVCMVTIGSLSGIASVAHSLSKALLH